MSNKTIQYKCKTQNEKHMFSLLGSICGIEVNVDVTTFNEHPWLLFNHHGLSGRRDAIIHVPEVELPALVTTIVATYNSVRVVKLNDDYDARIVRDGDEITVQVGCQKFTAAAIAELHRNMMELAAAVPVTATASDTAPSQKYYPLNTRFYRVEAGATRHYILRPMTNSSMGNNIALYDVETDALWGAWRVPNPEHGCTEQEFRDATADAHWPFIAEGL